MKTLRSPAVLFGLFVLVIVFAAGIFFLQPAALDRAEPPASTGTSVSPSGATGSPLPIVNVETDAVPTGVTPLIRWDVFEGATKRMQKGEHLISNEDVERHLRAKGETAMRLLAAAIATGNDDFLWRAAERFPDHPAVQLTILAKNKDLPAAERAEWIARFKVSNSESPLPFLYAAHQAFQQKDFSTALAAASEAIEKPGLYLWSTEFVDASQQLYESKGYSPLEAELFSAFSRQLTHLGDLQKVNADLVQLAEAASKENDSVNAEEALRVAYGMGKIFQSPEGSRTLIDQLVGISMEVRVLKAFPPEVQPSFLEVPRAQREAEITKLKNLMGEFMATASTFSSTQDPMLLSGFVQRCRSLGEFEAYLWLRKQVK